MRIRFAIVFALMLLGMPASGTAEENEALFFMAIPKDWSVAFDGSTEDARTIEFVPDGQTIHDWTEMISVYVFERQKIESASLYYALTFLDWEESCPGFGAAILRDGVEVEPGLILPDPSLPAAWFLIYCPWSDAQYTELQAPGAFGQVNTYYAVAGTNYLFVAQRSWRTAPFEGPNFPVPFETLEYESNRVARTILCESDVTDCSALAAEHLKSFTDAGDTILQVKGGLIP